MKSAWVVGGLVVVSLAFAAEHWLLGEDVLELPTEQVARGPVEATVTNSKAGTVLARRRAHLSPILSGRVVEILHAEGETVAAGDVLLRLEDSDQVARLTLAEREWELAKALLVQAEVSRDGAERELVRNRGLAEQKIVSGDVLDTLETTYLELRAAAEAARAQVEKALASVELARVEQEKTILRAPFAGVVAKVEAELGEWITPAPPLVPAPPAIDLIDPGSTYVEAPIDEVDSARIRVGQEVRITVDSRRGEHFAGRVLRVAPFVLDVEKQNRTVDVEVAWQDPEAARSILPGTSADVEIVLEAAASVLRIPATAVLPGGTVWVIANGSLEARRPELGIRNWEQAEVRSGLTAGETVVVGGDRTALLAGRRARAQEAKGERAP